MAVSATIYEYPNGIDNTQRRLIVHGTLVFSGTPASGGDTIAWAGIRSANDDMVTLDTAQPDPEIVYIQSIANSGYVYGWNKATNQVEVFVQGAAAGDALAPITSAYPSGVTGDTVEFEAQFIRSV